MQSTLQPIFRFPFHQFFLSATLPKPILSRILHRESRRRARTRLRRRPTRRVEPIYRLDLPRRSIRRLKIQPRHSAIAHTVNTQRRAGRGSRVGDFLRGNDAEVRGWVGGHVEHWGGGVGEVVVAGEVHVGREHGGADGGLGVVEGEVGEEGEEVWVGGGDAGGVVEGGDGAD
jgi:hypothetical protein